MKVFGQVVFLLLFIVCGVAFGQTSSSTTSGNFTNAGTSGALILKMPVGARAAAMGGAFVGMSGDITSVFWNPAGVASLKGQQADFEYSSSFGNISHSFLAGSIPISDEYTLAASLVSLSTGSIPLTTLLDQNGTSGATFSASDLVLGLTFAGNLTDKFSFGITGKYVRTGFYNLYASGLAFDVGTLYRTDFYGMTFGINIANLGTEEQYSGSGLLFPLTVNDPQSGNPLPSAQYPTVNATLPTNQFSLPLLFRAGASIDLLGQVAGVKDQKLNVAADFVTYSDYPETVQLGAEYWWEDLVAVRAGYEFFNNVYNFSAGVGLRYETGTFIGTINYAFQNTVNLGGINNIGVSLNFK